MAKIAAKKTKEKKLKLFKQQRKAVRQEWIYTLKNISKLTRHADRQFARMSELDVRINKLEEADMSFGFHETHT